MSQDNNIAIRVENLSKAYKLYNKPVDRMKESLHPLRKKYHHDFITENQCNPLIRLIRDSDNMHKKYVPRVFRAQQEMYRGEYAARLKFIDN